MKKVLLLSLFLISSQAAFATGKPSSLHGTASAPQNNPKMETQIICGSAFTMAEALKKLNNQIKEFKPTSVTPLESFTGEGYELEVSRPHVIFKDVDGEKHEPIEELIIELKKTVTIILVTHNIAQASRVSDCTAFLYMGELIEFGETTKMFTVPENKRTEEYLTGKFG